MTSGFLVFLLVPWAGSSSSIARCIGLGDQKGPCKKKRRASQVTLVAKNPPANEGDMDLILGLGRSPGGGGHGNPLQYSCLENPMDRGAWWSAVHRVAKSTI